MEQSQEQIKKLIEFEVENEISRRSFWEFCKRLAPDFYKNDRPHLKTLCDTLQAIYEGRIYKGENNEWYISQVKIEGLKACKKLIINMPPQHGKSRTLFMFCTWVFGKNPSEKVITASYNDSTASDFSKYTRDGILMQKNYPEHVVYSDIFPKTKIKKGTSSFEKWALEGQHFSYLGTGIGGSVTSKGATILMLDDPIKGAKEARSETYINNVWLWYTSTFSSRVSAEDGEPIEILNMTRWSINDPCGKILNDPIESNQWFVLKMEVYDSEKDEVLCPKLFSKERYFSQKRKMDEDIFLANYHQQPIDLKNKLFEPSQLNHFEISPDLIKEFEAGLAYTDVADQGNDDLSMPVCRNIKDRIYVVDWVHTKAVINGKDVGIEICAETLKKHSIKYNRVESNAMGAPFGRNLQRMVKTCTILLINNNANKHTRILMSEGFIKKYFYFLKPEHQPPMYKAAYNEMCAYDREGTVKKDDAPDGISGLQYMVESFLKKNYI